MPASPKNLQLDIYRWATRPYRWIKSFLDRRNGSVPVSILFYHRVADDFLNDWTITNEAFENQLSWLQSNFDLISIQEAQRRMASGHNDTPSVCITFDDGYADNCSQALPLLISRNIPFTYFVTWSNVVRLEPFPHDVLNKQPLEPNSLESIKALAAVGVEIGSHTMTHIDLGKVTDENRLRIELIDSKNQLEQAIGSPIRYFAFPYGQTSNLSQRAFEVGRECGYEAMCSAYGGYNEIGDDTFHLHRFHGDPNLRYLKNWLLNDPRKKLVRKFEVSQSNSKPPTARSKPEQVKTMHSNV